MGARRNFCKVEGKQAGDLATELSVPSGVQGQSAGGGDWGVSEQFLNGISAQAVLCY